MYRRETLILPSKLDGLELSVLVSLPEEGVDIRGVVQLVHGMAEYKERYLPLMEYLAGKGIACVIHDHRGHGKSLREEEDKGFLYGVGGDGLVEDTVQVTQYAKQRFSDAPIVLLGHSMGSLVARCYLRKNDWNLKGLILSGPPTENPAAKGGLALAKMQKTLRGGRSPGKMLEGIAFGGYYKRFPESRCAWVCADPVTVQAYEDDPMCGFTFTADGFVGLMELMCQTYEKTGWQCARPAMPILFLGGEEDPCIDGREKFEKAMAHLRGVGYRDVTGKQYPGLRHEIFNERCKYDIYGDVADFLNTIF